jgi:hypothetical protein
MKLSKTRSDQTNQTTNLLLTVRRSQRKKRNQKKKREGEPSQELRLVEILVTVAFII